MSSNKTAASAGGKFNGPNRVDIVQAGRIRRQEEAERQKHLEDAFVKSKRLKWSRTLRNEAYGKFTAARESLRALYDQIDFKKAELVQAREAFGDSNSIVKKHQSALRNTCVKHDIPEEYSVCRDANSSDYNHDTDSITDIDTDDEDLADAMKVDKK